MFLSHTFTAQSPLSPHPHRHRPCGAGRMNAPGRRHMVGVPSLQAGTRRQQPQAPSHTQAQAGHPRPLQVIPRVTKLSSGNRRRKERPFKGREKKKAFGEARARALFPLALIVRGVFGEEDSIVVARALLRLGQETREKTVRRHLRTRRGGEGRRPAAWCLTLASLCRPGSEC